MASHLEMIAGNTNDTQLVYRATQGSELLGYVVIDSAIGGRSCGGLRMVPDLGEEEIRLLARAMTLKFGFLGLPQGGAKAGLRGDPEAPQCERRRQLAEFAKSIAPLLLSRTYVPARDVGTDPTDIRYLLETVGMRVTRRELGSGRSGDYTAMTVCIAAGLALHHRGLNLAGCAVAIEGFGAVGSSLAGLLAQANARVVAVSTSQGALFNKRGLDVARLRQLAAEKGSRMIEYYRDAERIDRAALLELPVDLLCPCARHCTLNAGNAPRVSAAVICPGANSPITPEAEHWLFERGVLCLPDFVTNCGGVLGGTMEFASMKSKRIASFLEHYLGQRIPWLLEEASRKQVCPREIALTLALSRFEQLQRKAAHPTLLARTLEAGLELYRGGWIPASLVGKVSPYYFKRMVA